MGEATAESVDELLAMGGDALAGRRVQRLLPGGRGTYEGTVVGAAGRPDRLVAIDYDNGDVEELDAEDLADCLVPLPPRQRGLPRRAATAGAAAASAAAAEAEADEFGEDEEEEQEEEEPRVRRRAAAGPYARERRVAARHDAAGDPPRRRTRIPSAGKRFKGAWPQTEDWDALCLRADACVLSPGRVARFRHHPVRPNLEGADALSEVGASRARGLRGAMRAANATRDAQRASRDEKTPQTTLYAQI